jgi:CHASE3 domain sensor protein
LKIAKDRTLEQLESAREASDTVVREADVLKLQNEQMKKFIRRYKSMIDELLDKNQLKGQQSGASSQLSLKAHKQSDGKLDMATINL